MANDFNNVILIGRVTRDAELKYTPSGTAVTKFGLAVNRKRKQGDEYIEEASFFDITAWSKLAENLNQYLAKGKQVGVCGELRQDRWEDKDGNKRSKVGITATAIQLLGGDKRQESAPLHGSQDRHVHTEKPGEFDPNDFANSDIPF